MNRIFEQQQDNILCENVLALFLETAPKSGEIKRTPLPYMKATVCENDSYIWLNSCGNVVAFIQKDEPQLGYDIMRYTIGYNTTAEHHIRKFFNKYSIFGVVHWLPITSIYGDL